MSHQNPRKSFISHKGSWAARPSDAAAFQLGARHKMTKTSMQQGRSGNRLNRALQSTERITSRRIIPEALTEQGL